MSGLFSTLNLGTRSLQTQQKGVEIAGHNLANVNNPAYARQRLVVQTAQAVSTPSGLQGTGAQGSAVVQLRNNLLDRQILSENSVRGWLESQQGILQQAQSYLGFQVNRQSADGASAPGSVSQSGIADGLNDLFSSFQSLSLNPSSLVERQVALQKAADLAARLNQADQRLGALQSSLNESVVADVDGANNLLSDIARLNGQIQTSESRSGNPANDLRDLRQQKLDELSKTIKFDLSTDADGTVSVSVGGNKSGQWEPRGGNARGL